MKCSDYVAEFLSSKGVKYIFGYQGGSITHLIDSFLTHKDLNYIQSYNEQASALCAEAYSRVADEGIGVAIGSNGPGATNLITGIANAYCDSIPTLYITGQVHTNMIKKVKEIRQESFQEIDIISMVKEITKYCVTITDVKLIRYELEKAYYLAMKGRQGPVLIDIPVDIQGMDVDVDELIAYIPEELKLSLDIEEQLNRIINQLKKSKTPIILVGGGVWNSRAREKVRSLAHMLQVPVVSSLQGIDIMNHADDLYLGFIGVYGNRIANLAVHHADFLLVLGSRLDGRQIGKNREVFSPNSYKVHVDIDEFELNHTVKEDLSIHSDLSAFLIEFLRVLGKQNMDLEIWQEWKSLLYKWKYKYDDIERIDNLQLKSPYILLREMGKKLPDTSVVCTDVGQNQMWVAQALRIKGENIRIVNSGGLGTMGYSLPAGIAVYYTGKYENIICIMGDGGLQMNIQEFALVGSNQIPLKVFIMNNSSLGLIRDIHEKYYDNRCIGSIEGFSQPNLFYLAKAYNLEYLEINNCENLENLDYVLSDSRPYIINCILSQETKIIPELIGTAGLNEQIPCIFNEDSVMN